MVTSLDHRAAYELGIYDLDTYDDILPARITGGVQIVEAVCYRATKDNTHLEVIPVVGGEVAVDTTAAIPMTFTGELLGAETLTPYRDWIAPFITIVKPNPDGSGNVVETQQLGLYQVQPAQKRYTAASSRFAIDGRDPTWLLASDVIARPYNLPAGKNYSDAIRDLIESVGLTRHNISSTTKTMPRKRSWKPGTNKLQIANDLAKANGYLPLYPDRSGHLRSRRYERLHKVQPARTISSANGDVIRQITIDPDITRLCNHVIVIGNKPNGGLIFAERLNNDPSSPTSTVRIGTKDDPVVVTIYREDSTIDDQDAADQLADKLMDSGSSAWERVELTTFPIATWNLYDVIDCDVVNEAGEQVISGVWGWTGLRMGFGVDGRTTWTLGRLVSWAEVA